MIFVISVPSMRRLVKDCNHQHGDFRVKNSSAWHRAGRYRGGLGTARIEGMAQVRQMRLRLTERPEVVFPPGVTLRNYRNPSDSEWWLAIRQAAFAKQRLGVRSWSVADFEQEVLTRPWWKPERLWFAEGQASPGMKEIYQNPSQAVGTVILAERRTAAEVQPVVHWLAVLPAWRGRGIGRLLLTQLHQACWDAGWREVRLETHVAWEAAGKAYAAMGYEEVISDE
jgi:GNAT superfamily N-acetyltransferase